MVEWVGEFGKPQSQLRLEGIPGCWKVMFTLLQDTPYRILEVAGGFAVGSVVQGGASETRQTADRVAAGGEGWIGAARLGTRMPPVVRAVWRMPGGAVPG